MAERSKNASSDGVAGPSLRDVADRAGVSVSTVSRYLRGQLALRASTEVRIIGAMNDLGFRRPLGRTTRDAPDAPTTVGIIVPQMGHSYFGPLVDALISAADSHGLLAILGSTLSDPHKQLSYVSLLASRGVSGLVYVGNFRSNPALAQVVASGLPVVVVDEAIADLPEVDTVLVDDYAGAYHATSHLATLGHRRIALLTGNPELSSVSERTRGYADALKRSGIDMADQSIMHGDFTESFGAAALSHLLASDLPPTAVFASSDTIALGLMRAGRTLGVRVPEDLSIVGFDDVPGAGLMVPRLTTVHTPIEEMATVALRMLATRIRDTDIPPRRTIVPVTLVEGGSTAHI